MTKCRIIGKYTLKTPVNEGYPHKYLPVESVNNMKVCTSMYVLKLDIQHYFAYDIDGV